MSTHLEGDSMNRDIPEMSTMSESQPKFKIVHSCSNYNPFLRVRIALNQIIQWQIRLHSLADKKYIAGPK